MAARSVGIRGRGGGACPYQREMRLDSRSWGDHKKLDVATTFEGFQVWKDRAVTFLSRERPDVRRLLTWAETQSKEGFEAYLHSPVSVTHLTRPTIYSMSTVV